MIMEKSIEKSKKELLFAEERKQAILELLEENSKMTVQDLRDYFEVSAATIRNDLRELANAGLLTRTHGGALCILKAGFELNSYQKVVKNLPQKQAIAKKALDYIVDGDTIAIDTGTTTLEFAKLLSSKKHLTIIVNDIEIARCLEDETDAVIILVGGHVRRNFNCTVGPVAIKSLSGLNVDTAFMATNGLTVKRGLTTPDINQAEIKRAMIDIAAEVIVLCDGSKIGNTAFAQVSSIERVKRIITDDTADEAEINNIVSYGIQVDIVNI
jgi:DeoR family fructose operon transcriptional repressor